jgi:hypothetical protein
MRNPVSYVWQRSWFLLFVIPLTLFLAQSNIGHTTPVTSPQLPLPDPAGPPEAATHLLFVSFPENDGVGGEK